MVAEDALGTAAQVAVALAGFSGLIASFEERGVRSLDAASRLRLSLLLADSITPLVLCLIALFLLSTSLPERTIWRLCSVAAVVSLFTTGMVAVRSFKRVPRQAMREGGASRYVFFSIAICGGLLGVLLCYNALTLAAFWPFYGTIVFSMCVAVLQFIRSVTTLHSR